MAGNYEYPGKVFAWTKDPDQWFVGLFSRRYLTTYINGTFRLRSSLKDSNHRMISQRVFSLKVWGKDGYK